MKSAHFSLSIIILLCISKWGDEEMNSWYSLMAAFRTSFEILPLYLSIYLSISTYILKEYENSSNKLCVFYVIVIV